MCIMWGPEGIGSPGVKGCDLPVWVLGTEFRACARAVHAASPAPEEDLKITNQNNY